MAITRLTADRVGPFDKLDIDFSDGKGKAHLGPHVFAGVNGSGKSTVLKTIAFVMDTRPKESGFALEEFLHLARSGFVRLQADGIGYRRNMEKSIYPADVVNGVLYHAPVTVAYAPNPYSLSHLHAADLHEGASPWRGNLNFERTVSNAGVQGGLLRLLSQRALALQHRQQDESYSDRVGRLNAALSELYGTETTIDVDPLKFQLFVQIFGQRLNFSQLPDGVKNTLGWTLDFAIRTMGLQDGDARTIALFDEVDAHLHPVWQRRILPALRKAMPDTQIIATTHSPFVISSCPGARIHILEVNAQGRATVRKPIDAPIGESVTTILKDIFGVSSRFDIETERELGEWDELMRERSAGEISPKSRARLKLLTTRLGKRSEELRSIVSALEPGTSPALEQLRKEIRHKRNGH